MIVRQGHRGYRIHVAVVNTYKPMLMLFKDTFSGAIYLAAHDIPGRRRAWRWDAYGGTAYNFLLTILPYLREKASQAAEVIKFSELYGNYRRRTILVKEDQ